MRKALTKAIMCRSQLEKKYFKTKSQTDLKLYKKQKDFCDQLCKKERSKHFELLDMKNVLVKKRFQKTMKPFLSDKNTSLQIRLEKEQQNFIW